MYSGTCVPVPGIASTPGTRDSSREVALQLEHVLGESVRRVGVATQRPQRVLVGAGRAAEAEVDPARVQRRERAELLGDRERRVVRQHDPAGAEADACRCGRRRAR